MIQQPRDEDIVSIEREPVIWQVEFRLPDCYRGLEKGIEGCFLLRFYTDPIPGDVIHWGNFRWSVFGRAFYPAQYEDSSAPDPVPTLFVRFIDTDSIDKAISSLPLEAVAIFRLSQKYGSVSAKDCKNGSWFLNQKTVAEIEDYFRLLENTGVGVTEEEGGEEEEKLLKFCV